METIALDYSVRDDVIIKNLSGAMTCQRCGTPSKKSICDICNPPVHKPSHVSHALAGQYVTVTVRGCEIYVNNNYDHTEPSNFRAQIVANSMRRRVASRNLSTLELSKAIAKGRI